MKHNDNWHGREPEGFVPPVGRVHSLEERFRAKYTAGNQEECWIWEGVTSPPSGHGQFSVGGRPPKGRSLGAHVVSWQLDRGCLRPEGMVVRHLCHTPACVNPAHLALGTQVDNAADSLLAGKWPRSLSDEQITDAVLMYESGAHADDVARKFGVKGPTGIYSMLRRGGAKMRSAGKPRTHATKELYIVSAYRGGKTQSQVARAFRMDPSVVCDVLVRRGAKTRSASRRVEV